MKQPVVLYILTKLELGGAQKVCLALHEELKQRGYTTILISGTEGVLVEKAESIGSCILLPSLKRELSFNALKDELKTFINLIKIIRAYKKKYPDLIIHTHSTKAGIIGRWAAFFAGAKNRIHTVHGFGFNDHQNLIKRAIIITLEWLTTLISTRIICVSKKDLAVGTKLLPRFEKKGILIRAAIADSFFYSQKTIRDINKKKSITLGTISCFKPQKNLFDLLEAFKEVVKQCPHTNLEIIGDGEQRSAIEKWITSNNLADHITLHGWQNNVKIFLERWDIFTLSSLWEGLPCSLIEARKSALAIVAYNVGGIEEIVHHGKNGFLITPGDKKSLAEHIMKLITNRHLLAKFQLHKEDLSFFSTRSMVNAHSILYSNIKNTV